MTMASAHLDQKRRSRTQNRRSAGLTSGRRFCKTVASCCRKAKFSRTRSRRELNPERSAVTKVVMCRNTEGGEGVAPAQNRPRVSE